MPTTTERFPDPARLSTRSIRPFGGNVIDIVDPWSSANSVRENLGSFTAACRAPASTRMNRNSPRYELAQTTSDDSRRHASEPLAKGGPNNGLPANGWSKSSAPIPRRHVNRSPSIEYSCTGVLSEARPKTYRLPRSSHTSDPAPPFSEASLSRRGGTDLIEKTVTRRSIPSMTNSTLSPASATASGPTNSPRPLPGPPMRPRSLPSESSTTTSLARSSST